MAKKLKSFRISEEVDNRLKQEAQRLQRTDSWLVEYLLKVSLGIIEPIPGLGNPQARRKAA